MSAPLRAFTLTRSHRILIAIVLAGAVMIAAIGFAGSYAAVRDLAERKGFGGFAPFFPIGIDAGIVVLLALDLLLTWLRIPFPLLRQTAWLLTAATIVFNGAASWGDPLGVGMHAIIPVLFVITVEAARHAIGRVADITADRHMEGVRAWRWLLSPIPTFRLWRRMKLWELRSYEDVIAMERDRLVYQARLRARYGRAWRRRAPLDERMPLRLTRYGMPLAEARGLVLAEDNRAQEHHAEPPRALAPAAVPPPIPADPAPGPAPGPGPVSEPVPAPVPLPTLEPRPQPQPEPVPGPEPVPEPVTVPAGPGRRRSLGRAPANGRAPEPGPEPLGLPEDATPSDAFFAAYRQYVLEQGRFPNARQLGRFLHDRFGVTSADGSVLSEQYLREFLRGLRERYNAEMGMSG